jgi:hypothetical protein
MKPNLLWMLVISIILGSARPLQAQLAPMGPFGPTSNEECEAFSREVNQYWASINQKHEDCLASHKADKQNEQPSSRTCSRSACQGLHDQLYGDFGLTGKTHQQVQQDAVSACYNTAREALKRQAQAQQEETNRKATQAREEEQRERQKIQADHANAQTAKANTAQQAQTGKQVTNPAVLPKSQSPSSPQPNSGGSMNVQETREQERARLAARESEQLPRSQQALQEMIDPFAKPGKQAPQNKSNESPDGMVDPFSSGNQKSKGIVPKGQIQDYSLAVEEKAVETGMKLTESAIDKEVAAAEKVLLGDDLKIFEIHAERSKSVVHGFGTALTLVHYGKDSALVVVASDDRERARAGSDLFLDVVKDGFMAVTKRFSLVTSEILEGPVGWVAGSIFDPTEEHLDAQYVLSHDQQFSFQEREKALDELYSQYDHHRDLWGKPQVQNLVRLTKQLYESPDNPNIHLAPP